MARVLYGVMGNTYGHVARSRAIASRLPEHEFQFIGGGRVPEVLATEYPVHEVPVARTIYKNQRAATIATTGQLVRCVIQRPTVHRQIRDLIERWQPDVAICDREFYLPHAARAAGLRCFAVDHSHVLQACRYPVPGGQRSSWALGRLEDALFFNQTRHNLIVSFYHPPLRPGGRNELLPPIIRQAVRDTRPTTGDHIFVYQSTPAFAPQLAALRQLGRPLIVYGLRREPAVQGNVTYRPFDNHAILADLAGCAYAVINGGHNLICEALALGKPLLCFPIANTYEQFLNGWYLRELGYGDFVAHHQPAAAEFTQFEARLADYRRAIAAKFVDGTDQVIRRVREVIAGDA